MKARSFTSDSHPSHVRARAPSSLPPSLPSAQTTRQFVKTNIRLHDDHVDDDGDSLESEMCGHSTSLCKDQRLHWSQSASPLAGSEMVKKATNTHSRPVMPKRGPRHKRRRRRRESQLLCRPKRGWCLKFASENCEASVTLALAFGTSTRTVSYHHDKINFEKFVIHI